ncbi:MAG: hypothetical protein FWH07_02820 [Oscillospiraceae bacterium]|nr:hypothetical protein [Oscillospiraceae bacterium]
MSRNTETNTEIIATEESANTNPNGASVTHSEESTKKAFKIAVPIAILMLVAVVAAIFFGGNTPYGERKDLVLFHGVNKTFIAFNNGTQTETDFKVHDIQHSLDGAAAAIMFDFDSTAGKGTLYYARGELLHYVADNVYGYALADSGDSVIYFTELNSSGNTAVLNLYDGSVGSVGVIDNDVFYDRYSSSASTVISPDGETVFYLKDGNGYVSTGGDAGFEIGVGNITPIAVADGAKYLYYTLGGSFVVQSGTNGEPLEIAGGSVYGIFFNNDYSQVVFNESAGRMNALISIGGGESRKIANTQISEFIIPENGQARSDSGYAVYGFADFKDKVFYSGDGIFLLNSEFERERIANYASEIIMSSDGKQVFFLEGTKLKVATVSEPGGRKHVLAEDVVRFAVASGGNFYYVNTGNELYRQNARNVQSNSAAGTWVAEFVNADSLTKSGNGTLFFLSSDDELFSATNTGKTRIKAGVVKVEAYSNNVFYYTDEGEGFYDVYRSGGNSRFTRLLYDVKLGNISTDFSGDSWDDFDLSETDSWDDYDWDDYDWDEEDYYDDDYYWDD